MTRKVFDLVYSSRSLPNSLGVLRMLIEWKASQSTASEFPDLLFDEEELDWLKNVKLQQRQFVAYLDTFTDKFPALVSQIIEFRQAQVRKVSKYFANLEIGGLLQALAVDGKWYTATVCRIEGEFEPKIYVRFQGRHQRFDEYYELSNLEHLRMLAPFSEAKISFGLDYRRGMAAIPNLNDGIDLIWEDIYFIDTNTARPHGTQI